MNSAAVLPRLPVRTIAATAVFTPTMAGLLFFGNNKWKELDICLVFSTSFALVSLHVQADLLFGPGDEARLKQALADGLVSQKLPKR